VGKVECGQKRTGEGTEGFMFVYTDVYAPTNFKAVGTPQLLSFA